ncbi:DUF1360 domain-containing protein [bacterium]|nr:DUF1360 domain-containing protein [bacterium]
MWRISRMVAQEPGPFEVFETLRYTLTQRAGVLLQVGLALSCVYCLSVYVAAAALLLMTHPAGMVVLHVFALSGAAVLLHNVSEVIGNGGQ